MDKYAWTEKHLPLSFEISPAAVLITATRIFPAVSYTGVPDRPQTTCNPEAGRRTIFPLEASNAGIFPSTRRCNEGAYEAMWNPLPL